MALLTVVLLGVALLKAIAIGHAINWIRQNGLTYQRMLHSTSPRSIDEQEKVYAQTSANFFPFGLKDYRLRRAIRTRQLPLPRIVVPAAWLFRAVFFNFAWLVVLCAADLVVAPHLTGMVPDLLPRRLYDAAAVALIFVLMTIPIMLAMEATYSYSQLGSYATAFHELRPERRTLEGLPLREFNSYVGALFAAHLSGVAAMYFVAGRFGGYRELRNLPSGSADVTRRIISCSYYTLSTFLGAGDAGPQSVLARLVSGFIELQGFALLLVVLAAMLSHATAAHGDIPATVSEDVASNMAEAPSPIESTLIERVDPPRKGNECFGREATAVILGSVVTFAILLAWSRYRSPSDRSGCNRDHEREERL